VTIARRSILGCAIAPLLRSASLPEQSAAIILELGFPDPASSYLLLDAADGRAICSRWMDVDEPIPVGSLVKPFTALAYGQTHKFQFPTIVCKGEQSRCWLPQGHGRMELRTAIAHSCNAYFLVLASSVDRAALDGVTQKFSLNSPDLGSGPATLIGLGSMWRISASSLANAYIELAARSAEAGVSTLLSGMALSAKLGTGRGAGAGAYVKTGTAPCLDELKHAGDGFAIALYPTSAPRFALMVRVHGVPGAQAASVAGRMRKALGAAK
jgi:cell division protein FtsI/penicillin-binding protein 2